MLNLTMGCLFRSQGNWDLKNGTFSKGGGRPFSTWRGLKCFSKLEPWLPFFFVKRCLILRTGIGTLPSNFTDATIHCISIDGYPGPSILFCILSWTLKGVSKTDWLEWYQKRQLLTKTRTSWYQSIDKQHLWLYANFDGGKSIPFTRKLRSKKVGLFSNFPNDGVCKIKSLLYAGPRRSPSTQSPNDRY
jgi:hypothetical protein